MRSEAATAPEIGSFIPNKRMVAEAAIAARSGTGGVVIGHDMDHVVLDAVLAWLDGESLLLAGLVCRRWAELVERTEAWRGRVVDVAWARGMPPCEAYRRSLNVGARWRRGRVAVTPLGQDCDRVLCADGDWLAHTALRSTVRRARLAWSPAVRIHDAALARTIGMVPGAADLVVLSRKNALCAVIPPSRAPDFDTACEVWAPTAASDGRDRTPGESDSNSDGGDDSAWHLTCRLLFPWSSPPFVSLHWQHDRLVAHRRAYSVYDSVEWIDLGAGAPRVASSHEFRDLGQGSLVVLGACAYMADLRSFDVRVLDTRSGPALHVRLRSAAGRLVRVCALDDGGRRLATEGLVSDAVYGNITEVWDLRAAQAHARAGPVASRREDARWLHTLCATARDTLLGWGGLSRADIVEWDPARGSTEQLFAVNMPGSDRAECVWADERRSAWNAAGTGLFLVDADADRRGAARLS